GTTGESPSLNKEETTVLYKEVKDAVGNRGFVIGGCGGNNTYAVAEQMKDLNKLGLDGYLTVVPYYSKPTQEGIYKHYEMLSGVSSAPIIVYNIPGRTGVNLCPDTLIRMAELTNIKAVKESTGNVDQISEMKLRLPSDFAIYSGDDFMTLPMVAMGCQGVISVASHIVGKEIKEMVLAVKANDMVKGRDLHYKLYPIFKGMFCTANPIPVKTALNLLGFDVGGFRLPLCEGESTHVDFLKNLLKQYGML
ncbi:MAG: 4-hydroxy-tetrahydrodipicolinate synthase, partial [Clostridiales bacterium]